MSILWVLYNEYYRTCLTAQRSAEKQEYSTNIRKVYVEYTMSIRWLYNEYYTTCLTAQRLAEKQEYTSIQRVYEYTTSIRQVYDKYMMIIRQIYDEHTTSTIRLVWQPIDQLKNKRTPLGCSLATVQTNIWDSSFAPPFESSCHLCIFIFCNSLFQLGALEYF